MSGRLEVADIGLQPWCERLLREAEVADLAAPSPRLGKAGGHKYDHGHALVLSGGLARGGARGWPRGRRCGWGRGW